MEKTIEIPFGTKDSELYDFEYTIPEGYDAKIKDGKIIVRKSESGDERIRKGLLYVIDHHPTLPTEEAEMYIAWLKKQGEQKTTEEIISNPDYISPKDKALFKIATVLSQHEDKNGSPLEEIRSILVDYGINNLESNEQKPGWSDEKRREFIGELQSLMLEWSNKKEDMGVCIDRHIDKLLSIVSDSKPIGWSEEDEVHRQWILEFLVDGKRKVLEYSEQYQLAFDWLKSLRPKLMEKNSKRTLTYVKKSN